MSQVFFSKDNLESLMEKNNLASVVRQGDFVAVKLHFGEKGNKGYVRPELVSKIIGAIKALGGRPFLTDANTIYRGARSDGVSHLETAHEHGFGKLGVPIIIADGLRGKDQVEVEINQRHIKAAKIARAIAEADSIVFVTHFKGHDLTGFGGAVKNVGMGCASKAGKYEMHNGAVPKVSLAKCNGCGTCVAWCSGGALKLEARHSARDARGSPARRSAPSLKLWSVGDLGVGGSLVTHPSPHPSPQRGEGDWKPGEGDERRTTNDERRIQFDPAKCVGCGQCIISCPTKVFNIPWDSPAKIVQERIAEYAYAVLKDKRAAFFSFLTFITSTCDCFKTIGEPLIPDVGILASHDPVAIDQASIDLADKAAGRPLFRNYEPQLEHAERLGVGKRRYELTSNV